MASPPTLVKLKILTDLAEKQRAYGFVGISIEHKLIQCYITSNDKVMREIRKDRFVALRNVDISKIEDALDPPFEKCLLSEKSQIFGAKEFPINEDVVDRFFRAPVVSVRETLEMPPKRRISVSGIVDSVSPEKTIEGRLRRDIIVRQPNAETRVTIKMWNSSSSYAGSVEKGDSVIVFNVNTYIYQNLRWLNSTDETFVKVVDPTPIEREESIYGVTAIENTIELLTESNEVYTMERRLFDNLRLGSDPETLNDLRVKMWTMDKNVVRIEVGGGKDMENGSG